MGLRETLERIASEEAEPVASRAEVEAFDAAASSLLDAMMVWLRPRVGNGHAGIRRRRTVMREDGIPPREVPVLDIVAVGVTVTVYPVATKVAGASGRLDMALSEGGGPQWMILRDLGGRAGWRAGWKGDAAFPTIDGPRFLSALDRIVRGGNRGVGPAQAPVATESPNRSDGVALLRRIVDIAERADASPSDHEEAIRTIRGDLETALADPVRDALAQVLQALAEAHTPAYAVRIAAIRASDGLRALGEDRG